MTDFAIEFKKVVKQYDDFMLHDVSFVLPRGCIMGIIGENGAGKSTMIKLMLNLIQKEAGKITVLGCDSDRLSRSVREKIGVVFDECCFPENLKLKEIEKILKNIYQHWNSKAFKEYAATFNLPENKAVKDFSRGMKMKLSIAAALSHHAELLILDEATSGLDPVVRDEILDVFFDFIQEEKNSILISSHITSDLEKICDYITFLNNGSIIMSEAKDDILTKYVVVKGGRDELESLPKEEIIGIRKSQFGAEALIRRQAAPIGFVVEPADLEQIMLFNIRKEQ